MPKYTEQTWRIVNAAAEIMALGIMETMNVDLNERFPDFTPEERTLIRYRMVRFADRMVAIAGYDPGEMDWHQEDAIDEQPENQDAG